MVRTSLQLRTAAERLLALEAASRGADKLPTAVRVTDRLGKLLGSLLGSAGFQALLARAVRLAKAELPALRAVGVQADGSLEGLDELSGHDGEIVLVAHILGLLVTFVGEALMLRLVSDAWPKARLHDLDFRQG